MAAPYGQGLDTSFVHALVSGLLAVVVTTIYRYHREP